VGEARRHGPRSSPSCPLTIADAGKCFRVPRLQPTSTKFLLMMTCCAYDTRTPNAPFTLHIPQKLSHRSLLLYIVNRARCGGINNDRLGNDIIDSQAVPIFYVLLFGARLHCRNVHHGACEVLLLSGGQRLTRSVLGKEQQLPRGDTPSSWREKVIPSKRGHCSDGIIPPSWICDSTIPTPNTPLLGRSPGRA
jgi:hypothetical protein